MTYTDIEAIRSGNIGAAYNSNFYQILRIHLQWTKANQMRGMRDWEGTLQWTTELNTIESELYSFLDPKHDLPELDKMRVWEGSVCRDLIGNKFSDAQKLNRIREKLDKYEKYLRTLQHVKGLGLKAAQNQGKAVLRG